MTDHIWNVGGAGQIMIRDTGSTVEYYVWPGYSSTWWGSVSNSWATPHTSGSGNFGVSTPGNQWKHIHTHTATASGNYSWSIGNTGTSGFGGPHSVSVNISRPTVPQAPTTLGFDQITANSMRYRFSGNGDGGSGILEWQAQFATNSAFTTGVQEVSSSGTTTFSGLANHTTYWARSRGRNAVGWSGYSAASSAATLGHPSAPLSVSAVASTSVTGRVTVSWSPPTTTGAGGITGYNVFRDGVQIATITGTTTTHTDTGRTPFTTYAYTVRARNAYSDSVSSYGPLSGAANVVAQGPPTAPQNLSGVSHATIPGRVDLTWSAPTTTGTGGITGYRIRLADGTLLANQNGTGTTYSATNLNPGTSYTFKVSARNALSDAEGSEGAFSNQVSVTPIGEPQAPTSMAVAVSSTTSNRLVLSWVAPAGALSGYSIFQLIDGSFQLIAKIGQQHTSFAVDNLTSGTGYTFQVRARTAYTDTLADGYPGNWGGPPSASATATATVNNSQSVPTSAAITSITNSIFNGSYVISSVTSNTLSYAKVAANITNSASGGSVSNTTNATFNGTFAITASTASTFSYAKTASNIAPLSVSGGTLTNSTNQGLNGTFTVTAVNVGANLVSYASSGSDFSSRSVPINAAPGAFSTITNLSNAIFNGAGKVITAVTEYTIKYAQTNANVVESNSAGTITNTTNRDIFNGTYVVSSIPAYNKVLYAKTASNIALRTWFNPNGIIHRETSPATLDFRFRSGWAG